MNTITEYDYSGISSAVAASQVQTVKQTENQQQESKKVDGVQKLETDSYEHVEDSSTLASVGIYDANGKLAGTAETEKQRSESESESKSESKSESESESKSGSVSKSKSESESESDAAHFAVKADAKDESAKSSGAAPVSSSDDSDDDSTETKVVTINGETYLETTVVKDGVKTVTRKNMSTGEIEVTRSKNS